MIHLSLAPTFHRDRMINFYWILVIYATGYELNIKFSSVVFLVNLHALERWYKKNMNDQAEKKIFWEFCPHLYLYQCFSYMNICKTPCLTYFQVYSEWEKKETPWETENSVLGKLWHIAWNSRISLRCNMQIPNIQIYTIHTNSRVSDFKIKC